MARYEELGAEIGALVAEKNRAYGSSFQTAGDALSLLYPQGVRPEQMRDALLLVRIWDKMMRIATARDAFGESPYRDIAGYGILGAAMQSSTRREEQEVEPHPCASASVAANPSAEQSGSAANDVPRPITTNDAAPPPKSAPANSTPPYGASSASEAAYVPTATVDVFVREAVHARMRGRNARNECAGCNGHLEWGNTAMTRSIDGDRFAFCSGDCAREMAVRFGQ